MGSDRKMNDIRITTMSAETVEAVAALERECFSIPWSISSLTGELDNPLAVYFVAESGGTVAGYAGMHHIADEGYITNIAVTESHRREGVASRLVEALLAYGRTHGLTMLTLEVRPSNTAARALYRSFGFEPVGERRAYYQNPPENALILTRKLEPVFID